MILKIRKSTPKGTVKIPGSKSHTIRALYIASLAQGTSEILAPLESADTASAVQVCRALGAQVEQTGQGYCVTGVGGKPVAASTVVDVGNSGTSLRLGVAVAALAQGVTRFTGDDQIQSRPMGPLLHALYNLGAVVDCERKNDMAPLSIKGPIKGGKTELDAVTSQFLSALLVACPLCLVDTEIAVTRLNERPYVSITLWWLDRLGIRYKAGKDYESFLVPGNQAYKSFTQMIPADFSSATFFMAQAAISGQDLFLENLHMSDPQGDKAVLGYLEQMGAKVEIKNDGVIVGRTGKLKGCEIDMNATPDALPAMAVVGCFADGETVLCNVPQARLKETDRIRVMCSELKKMGADVKELSDALIVRKSHLEAAALKGYSDHRVVMALSVAGLNTQGETTVDTAEAINITFPNYVNLMHQCGADIQYDS